MKRLLSIGVFVTILFIISQAMAGGKTTDCKDDANKLLEIIERDMKPYELNSIKLAPSFSITSESYECILRELEKATGEKYLLERVPDDGSYILKKRTSYK